MDAVCSNLGEFAIKRRLFYEIPNSALIDQQYAPMPLSCSERTVTEICDETLNGR